MLTSRQGDASAKRAEFAWDVDLSLFGCGLPLPEAIEDRLISALVTFIINAYNQTNPIVIDLQKARPPSPPSRRHARHAHRSR